MSYMMIRMKEQLLGYHPDYDTGESVPWPPPGEVVKVTDREGVGRINNGSAVAVIDRDSSVEKRGPGRPRKTTYDNT